MSLGLHTKVTANCDDGVQSGELASVVEVQSWTGLQPRPWQPPNQQPSDFGERPADIAGGAFHAGPKQEYEAVGCLPRCEWLCQTDAKRLIAQEGAPG
ncbi:MAG TPA: hypothetical protein VJY33_06905 [Isosphaeraceae bacterium]|nr:hypothetical protein [Isosphaeraceae bacterium]